MLVSSVILGLCRVQPKTISLVFAASPLSPNIGRHLHVTEEQLVFGML